MTNPAESRWTAEKVATMRQMIFMGHTAAEIGDRLGMTRKAVIGKAYRKWGGFGAVLGTSTGERRQYHRTRLPPPPTAAELALRERIIAEEEKYVQFQKRDRVGNSCAAPGCRMAKQANRFNLCATHDQERIREKAAA
jgi:hypothetical protein